MISFLGELDHEAAPKFTFTSMAEDMLGII